MAKDSASINLLNRNKNNTVDQIVAWALTIGRTLIILTEVIALGAFFYRFFLDGQLQSLQSKIKQEQAIVESQQNNETLYRNLQDRLAIASQFGKSGGQNLKIFQDIVGFAPSGMTFTSANFSQSGMQMEANVTSVAALSTFINKLKQDPLIDTININNIENKTASAVIKVGMSVTIKQQGGGNTIAGN